MASAISSLLAEAKAGPSSQEELLVVQDSMTARMAERDPISRERPEAADGKHSSSLENRRLGEHPGRHVPQARLWTFPSVDESTILFLHVFKVRKHHKRQIQG